MSKSARTEEFDLQARGNATDGAAAGGEGATHAPRLKLRVDDRNLHANYANAFRSNASAEEVVMDFGLDMLLSVQRTKGAEPEGEALFQITDRIIMNYPTVKRLAISLGQLVRQHEAMFGEIELNPTANAQPQTKAG